MPLNILTADQRELVAPGGNVKTNPATHSHYAMALARALGVAARAGVFGALAQRPGLASELAAQLALDPGTTQTMLDLFVGEGLLERRDTYYGLSDEGQRWLDPDSATSITTFLSHTLEYWEWLGNLDQLLRGDVIDSTRPDVDDESRWLRRVRAEYEMARLVSDEVATAIGLPDSARSVLDVGGGHGEFAAAICRRNRRMRATVIDEAGAAAIGRELTWEAGMENVITHEVGTINTADLGGPHDAVIYHPMMSRSPGPMGNLLLERVRAALRPGGVLVFFQPGDSENVGSPAAAMKLLLWARSGGGAISSPASATMDLVSAGFAAPRVYRLRRTPSARLNIASAI